MSAPAVGRRADEPSAPRRLTGYLTPEGERISRSGLAARYTVLLVMVVVAVGPFLWQLSTSFKDITDEVFSSPPQLLPASPTLSNYSEVADVVPVWRYTTNSVLVAVLNVGANVVGSSMAGYALARLRFRGRGVALGVLVAAVLIPGETSLIALLQLVGSMGLTDTLVAVFLPTAVSAINVFLMRNAFLALPREVEEASLIDGANAWQRFVRVALPSARGTLAVIALLSFMASWSDFLWPLLVLSSPENYTLSVGLNYLNGTFAQDPRLVAAGTVIAVAPLVALFLAAQKQFFRGIGEGAVKG